LLCHVQDRPGHDRRYALSSKKISRELAWEPQISLKDGLHQTVDWYKANASWVKAVRSGEYLAYYKKNYEDRDSALSSL
jgi:dTDP-glucose 4,6-dehydratase